MRRSRHPEEDILQDGGRQLVGYYYSLNAGSNPYTSLMER